MYIAHAHRRAPRRAGLTAEQARHGRRTSTERMRLMRARRRAAQQDAVLLPATLTMLRRKLPAWRLVADRALTLAFIMCAFCGTCAFLSDYRSHGFSQVAPAGALLCFHSDGLPPHASDAHVTGFTLSPACTAEGAPCNQGPAVIANAFLHQQATDITTGNWWCCAHCATHDHVRQGALVTHHPDYIRAVVAADPMQVRAGAVVNPMPEQLVQTPVHAVPHTQVCPRAVQAMLLSLLDVGMDLKGWASGFMRGTLRTHILDSPLLSWARVDSRTVELPLDSYILRLLQWSEQHNQLFDFFKCLLQRGLMQYGYPTVDVSFLGPRTLANMHLTADLRSLPKTGAPEATGALGLLDHCAQNARGCRHDLYEVRLLWGMGACTHVPGVVDIHMPVHIVWHALPRCLPSALSTVPPVGGQHCIAHSARRWQPPTGGVERWCTRIAASCPGACASRPDIGVRAVPLPVPVCCGYVPPWHGWLLQLVTVHATPHVHVVQPLHAVQDVPLADVAAAPVQRHFERGEHKPGIARKGSPASEG